MFKKPTKRQLLIRRILLSSVATLSVIIIATVTILFMLGFRLDSGNGRLEQGALLQLDSNPNGADVFIDGKILGSKTATKQTVIAGTHTIKMTRTGYQDWNRTLPFAAGTLTWLDYTRFVPIDRLVEVVTTYETLTDLTISPDSKWALAQPKTDQAAFQLVDLRSEEVKSSAIIIPQENYSEAGREGVTHAFSLSSWDSGSRYVLVKHLYGDQTEWLVVDTQNVSETTNVTQLLGVGFSDIQFASTNGKVLYGLTNDGAIRKLDLSAGTLSRTFVTHAESFHVFNNTVVSYIGLNPTDPAERVAGVYRDGDEASHVLRTVAVSELPLKITTGRYVSDDYVAIAEGNVVTVLKGSYPSSSSQDNSSLQPFTTFELSGAVSAVSFSPNGDYVFAQSGESYKSYEIEHARAAAGMISVSEGTAASTLTWLDTAHLWNDDDGELVMRDFDGSNVYSIMSVESGYDASLSQNGRFFYAVGKSDNGYHLQRIEMILN